MTNFDPGWMLILLTVIPSVVVGISSIGAAHLATWLGYGEYERLVVVILGLLLGGWIVVARSVSSSMVTILGVCLAMLGAAIVTRDVRAASYGWVLGVVVLACLFAGSSALGIYRGIDANGMPVGVISRHLLAFYYGGLLVAGAVAGAVVQSFWRWRDGRGVGMHR